MSRSLIFVHGHYHKPSAADLSAIWTEALRAGVERDHAARVADFDALTTHMVYYGDLNDTVLAARELPFDPSLDAADRRNAIARLGQLNKPKKFNRYNYENTPGKSAVAELLADIGAPLLGKTGLMERVVGRLMPELAAYWDLNSDFYREVSARMLGVLRNVLDSGDDVMVIAHGLGGVVAYDALWQLSYGTADLAAYRDRKISRLLTMGTPLANDYVRTKLAGASEGVAERYPRNILNWYNISAEDDFVCHDKTVSDDFRAMLEQHVISVIEDYRIYNLAVRYGKSNPHSVVGYLIHPRVTRLLNDWLSATCGT